MHCSHAFLDVFACKLLVGEVTILREKDIWRSMVICYCYQDMELT